VNSVYHLVPMRVEGAANRAFLKRYLYNPIEPVLVLFSLNRTTTDP
jgi:hypothetical protein